MGALGEAGAPGNEWHLADTWPPEPYVQFPLYLASDDTLSGILPGEQTALDYDYNPSQPVPSTGGQLLYGGGVEDQTPLYARADVLHFESEMAEPPLTITGPITVRLYVASEAVDTDFTAKLVDVYPNGLRVNIADGIRRLRYRTPTRPRSPTCPAPSMHSTSTSGTPATSSTRATASACSSRPAAARASCRIQTMATRNSAKATPRLSPTTPFAGGATPSAIYLPIITD